MTELQNKTLCVKPGAPLKARHNLTRGYPNFIGIFIRKCPSSIGISMARNDNKRCVSKTLHHILVALLSQQIFPVTVGPPLPLREGHVTTSYPSITKYKNTFQNILQCSFDVWITNNFLKFLEGVAVIQWTSAVKHTNVFTCYPSEPITQKTPTFFRCQILEI